MFMSCFCIISDHNSFIELMYFYMLFQGLIVFDYVGYLVFLGFSTQSNGRIAVEMELLLVTGSSRELVMVIQVKVASLIHEKLHP